MRVLEICAIAVLAKVVGVGSVVAALAARWFAQ
jgi:hypothetical protein